MLTVWQKKVMVKVMVMWETVELTVDDGEQNVEKRLKGKSAIHTT